MSSLQFTEKAKLEKLLDMGDGYVSDFSNSTFATFFADLEVDIEDVKYHLQGTSKAKRLREFWKIESDYIVGKSIAALVEHHENVPLRWNEKANEKDQLLNNCKTIYSRLQGGQVNFDHLKSSAINFDEKHLAEQVKRLESSIVNDPELAIGTAKELIETTCKTILRERGKAIDGTPDMAKLTKETLKELKLVPEGIDSETRGGDVTKRILHNMGAIGNGLAELRGMYGTGHGKDSNAKGLGVRHAKLAAGASITLATFLFETHQEMKDK